MKKSSFQSFLTALYQAREKVIRIFLGLFLVYFVSSLLFTRIEPLATWVAAIENFTYDWQVRHLHKPLDKNNSIVIVDIDDKSLASEGRWPWPRKTFAELVAKLYKNGAVVIAFDVTFPDSESNIAEAVIDVAKTRAELASDTLAKLEGVKQAFEYDELLSASLQMGESVLGMIFSDQGEIAGVLPKPILQLTPAMMDQLAIPNKKGYLANISQLQKSSKSEGFINTSPDADGVLRFTPLIVRNEANVYGALSLQAASTYLLAQTPKLITAKYGNSAVLEGIQLDQLFIPTDPTGRLLIPFRGGSYTFPYISAIDVLNDSVSKADINGKLVFVGSSASAVSDNHSTAVAPVFPGIEVHASVASGIIDRYLPFKPTWGRGVTYLLVLVIGISYALILPFLEVLMICALCFFLPLGLVLGNDWLWSSYGIAISIALPIGLVAALFLLNIIWGYLCESRHAKAVKSMFGQYVPPAYLDEMIEKGEGISLEGESKELSVLFADIRNFTNLSEKMSAVELKQFLNHYFTPVTEIIFNHQGTIDKYVGDMVMAFWGAPLDDPKHALNAVETGLVMQAALTKLNVDFLAEKRPEIRIGIGINTGLMNVGDMGSKFRRAYTVLGDAVNLASRLEGQTKFYPFDILVGATTFLQTKEAFVYRKVDKIRVKGKDVSVDIFTPLCKVENGTSEMQLELDRHHQALEFYFQQQWDSAERVFQELVISYPSHKNLYEVYLERIQLLRQNPPAVDWDGAYISHEK